MLRRDYVLRMIQEAAELLSRLQSLKKDQKWSDAEGSLDAELEKLVGANAQTVASLSVTELLARVIRGESTLAVKEKTIFVSALLKEAGDIATAQNREEEALSCYTKGLDLLLDVLREGEDYQFPEFMPRVETFVSALADATLPLPTQAALMHHYERTGQLGKAEDILFSMLDAQPGNAELIGFGISFYKRLEKMPDDRLIGGNLPREELESGLQELHAMQR